MCMKNAFLRQIEEEVTYLSNVMSPPRMELSVPFSVVFHCASQGLSTFLMLLVKLVPGSFVAAVFTKCSPLLCSVTCC